MELAGVCLDVAGAVAVSDGAARRLREQLGGHPANIAVLAVLLEALAGVENQQAFLYLELVLAALPVAARRHLEELMSTQT